MSERQSGPEGADTGVRALERYRDFLERGTFEGGWPANGPRPQSRYHSFRRAFELFRAARGSVVVELGTIRSYTHGGLPGCNTDDRRAWTPGSPENWDWGAGIFSRVAAECLGDLHPVIHTVDVSRRHLRRCQVVNRPYRHLMRYHRRDSRDFLRSFRGTADLLYLDTGDMTPIEPVARLQREEAEIIVERGLVSPGGALLIDDVRNRTPRRFGDDSGLGKSKYSLPFLLGHGYRVEMDAYQVLLVRVS